jgi:hypothetical protein
MHKQRTASDTSNKDGDSKKQTARQGIAIMLLRCCIASFIGFIMHDGGCWMEFMAAMRDS